MKQFQTKMLLHKALLAYAGLINALSGCTLYFELINALSGCTLYFKDSASL